jgi:hypothetical protein
MECSVPYLETVFDKRSKHPVFLVDAIEESANVTLPAYRAVGTPYRLAFRWQMSPRK